MFSFFKTKLAKNIDTEEKKQERIERRRALFREARKKQAEAEDCDRS